MKLLVIGSGGREHALAWKLACSPRVSRVLVAPGNAGTAREDGLVNITATAIPDLVEFAKKEVASRATMYVKSERALLDRFIAELRAVSAGTRNDA